MTASGLPLGAPDLVTRFTSVATERRTSLLAIAGRMVGYADAEDVVQNALLDTFRALPRFHGDDGDLAAWLRRSTHNTALDWVRHRAVVSRHHTDSGPLESLVEPAPEPEAVALRREAMGEAQAQAAIILASLPGRYRRALWITAGLGVSTRDAGARWGVSRDLMKTLRERAQKRCRQQFVVHANGAQAG